MHCEVKRVVADAIATGMLYNTAYNSNFLGFKNWIDSIGHIIDDSFRKKNNKKPIKAITPYFIN